ncbi:MAG TPA: ParB/RepB/Spo0J family partition protein [Candidatus Limnocylindrales bacterium]
MTTEVRRSNTGLGRGLAALIPQRSEPQSSVDLPISAISRNPYQPREQFEQSQLDELAASIAEHGVLQPILVSEVSGGYQLIAGERRLRAAQLAGLERIPALVRSADDSAHLAWALIENLQRSDLNPLEEAAAYRRLIDEFSLSHDEVANRVGKSRSAVANTMRLLDLAPEVKDALLRGAISEGHARAIAGIDDLGQQAAVSMDVESRGLSVRQTEELVRRLRKERPAKTPRQRAPDVERLESALRDSLATKVTINTARRGGRITIEYYDEDDLERLYERLTGGKP